MPTRFSVTVLSILVGAAAMAGETRARYVPEPRPATTDYLVGAHYFPGWKMGTRWGWPKIEPYPKRRPLLGFYDEGNPEVADWEIKWALEHGISFFVYCWYRRGQGGPVTEKTNYLSHAIHDGLFKARYAGRFKFAIMWENQAKGQAGVASLNDLMQNLLPFWVKTYFKHPSYLKLDNRPVLFVYHLQRLIEDFGGVEKTRAALERMRQACREAGFSGLWLLCEYRGTDARVLQRIEACGFDHAFAYCWHASQKRPTAQQAIDRQLNAMNAWLNAGVLPFLPTASMGWDPLPWQNPKVPWLDPKTMTRWRLTPAQYKTVLERTKALMARLPADSLGRRMLLLDNWNEWGEGHYLAPHAEHGFGYMKAVREVFTRADNEPDYRAPADLGLGPYDSLCRKYLEEQKKGRPARTP
jgi:hypothetical protein